MNCDELMGKCKAEALARFGDKVDVDVALARIDSAKRWGCVLTVTTKAGAPVSAVHARGLTQGRAAASLARAMGVAWEGESHAGLTPEAARSSVDDGRVAEAALVPWLVSVALREGAESEGVLARALGVDRLELRRLALLGDEVATALRDDRVARARAHAEEAVERAGGEGEVP